MHSFHPSPMRRLAFLLLLIALALSACGTRGPLYLPSPDAKQDTDAKQKGR